TGELTEGVEEVDRGGRALVHGAGGDPAGPAHDEGDRDRGLPEVQGRGAVPLAPVPVMAAGEAVVRGEDHDRVLQDAAALEVLEERRDAAVHPADRGAVAGERAVAVRHGARGRT